MRYIVKLGMIAVKTVLTTLAYRHRADIILLASKQGFTPAGAENKTVAQEAGKVGPAPTSVIATAPARKVCVVLAPPYGNRL